jgi:hypothetical protein
LCRGGTNTGVHFVAEFALASLLLRNEFTAASRFNPHIYQAESSLFQLMSYLIKAQYSFLVLPQALVLKEQRVGASVASYLAAAHIWVHFTMDPGNQIRIVAYPMCPDSQKHSSSRFRSH